jgi:phosphatidylglycerophosphatase A
LPGPASSGNEGARGFSGELRLRRLLSNRSGHRWINSPAVELGAIVAVFAIGVWAAHGTEIALGRKDPGIVVIDEVLGMLMTLALLPVSIWGVILGFLFFRALDVVKPFPAAQLEHIHGGMGIMADDAVAGLYSHILLRICIWLVPAWLTV